jgi:hypothetical protein
LVTFPAKAVIWPLHRLYSELIIFAFRTRTIVRPQTQPQWSCSDLDNLVQTSTILFGPRWSCLDFDNPQRSSLNLDPLSNIFNTLCNSPSSLSKQVTSPTNICEAFSIISNFVNWLQTHFKRTSHTSVAVILSSHLRIVHPHLRSSSDKLIRWRTMTIFAFWRTWDNFEDFELLKGNTCMYLLVSFHLSRYRIIPSFTWCSLPHLITYIHPLFDTWGIFLFRIISYFLYTLYYVLF